MAAHPPLTSLRSFAPPCAEAKGAYVFPPSHSRPVIPSAARNLPPSTKWQGVRGMPSHLWMGVSRNAPTVDSGFRRNDVRGAVSYSMIRYCLYWSVVMPSRRYWLM